MILSGRILSNVASVNIFTYEDVAEFTEGDEGYVFIQLIDVTKDRADQGFKPGGRRFVPATGATLTVTVTSIDTAKTYSKVATMPFATDPSIWRISISATDQIVGTVDLKLTLLETTVTTRGIIKGALRVQPQITAY